MTDDREKRRDPRVPLVLRVEYPGVPQAQAVRDATENLSAGGLFIRTDRPLAIGDRLPLLISFPGLLEPTEVEVQVARLRPASEGVPAGIAVMIPVDRTDHRHKLARLAETARAAASAAASHKGYRVLVVEDNPHVIGMYEYALRKIGGPVPVAVEFASNGHDALRRLGESPRVDLVMSDLYMPVMDGFSLIERMRGEPDLAKIPILVISAGADDARVRAMDLGVDVYLQKPVQFADILTTVRTLLQIKS